MKIFGLTPEQASKFRFRFADMEVGGKQLELVPSKVVDDLIGKWSEDYKKSIRGDFEFKLVAGQDGGADDVVLMSSGPGHISMASAVSLKLALAREVIKAQEKKIAALEARLANTQPKKPRRVQGELHRGFSK